MTTKNIAKTVAKNEPYGLRIVVVQAGWVLIGIAKNADDEVNLTKAAVVRRWGTTEGLGQLAMEGPLAETILDYCVESNIKNHAVIFNIPCNEEAWKEYLANPKSKS